MRRLRSARAGAAAIGLLALGLSAAQRPIAFAPGEPLADKPAAVADVALPAGFAATIDRVTRDQLVGVVAGDLDHDGDLDVVASLGSLDLAVWRNDGAGHFTRLSSSPHAALQSQPPPPAVDGDLDGSHVSIQTRDSRDGGIAARRARAAEGPASVMTPSVRRAAGRFGPRPRSSRAPPLA